MTLKRNGQHKHSGQSGLSYRMEQEIENARSIRIETIQQWQAEWLSDGTIQPGDKFIAVNGMVSGPYDNFVDAMLVVWPANETKPVGHVERYDEPECTCNGTDRRNVCPACRQGDKTPMPWE